MRQVLALLFVLVLALPAAARQKQEVSGVWDITVESPQGPSNSELTLKADGGKLTGTLKGRRGELPVTGSVNGSDVKLAYTINFQGNDLNITLNGKVDGDAIKGEADFGGLASGTWSAKRRKEGAAKEGMQKETQGSGSVDKPNVTGAWDVTVETDAGSGNPSFTFKQEGEKLTGTYKGAFGEAPVEGTVKGNLINFSVKVNAQGVDAVITYSGTVEKDSMKGKVSLGDLGSGTFTGKRK